MEIIRQAAFSGARPLLKGCLHIHTTRSDGKLDPETAVRLYHARGYDFIALTDHRFYNFRQYAPETGVLVLPAMEMDGRITNGVNMCYHTVAVGVEKEDGNAFEQDQRFDSYPVQDAAGYQPTVDMLREAGNLVLYCHPEWSRTPARAFEGLKGCFGMEIWNTACVHRYGCDENAAWWDEMLMYGHKIWGVATDDAHNPDEYACACVMVNAGKDTGDILTALEAGAFYASAGGPEIRDFRVEDGKAVLECGSASSVLFSVGSVPTRIIRGEELTRAELELPEGVPYVRATVTGVRGLRSWTNPIFLR